MTYNYRPRGVCSQNMEIEVEGSKIVSLKVSGGCSGNLRGIAKLVEGMEISDVISRLEGVKCGFKSTSCPDQLAQALKEISAQQ